MPVAPVRRRPPIEYSIIHDARPAGPSIGTYDDHEFPELVVDGYGRLFEYAGVASRRIDGQFDDDALKPGEMIVRPGLVYRHRKQRDGIWAAVFTQDWSESWEHTCTQLLGKSRRPSHR